MHLSSTTNQPGGDHRETADPAVPSGSTVVG